MPHIKVFFSIYGDCFNPEEFSELVKEKASSFWYKNHFISEEKKIARKETAWEYVVESYNSIHTENILNILISKFGKYSNIISEYVDLNNLKVKTEIVIEISNNEVPSLYFNQDFIKFMSSIGSDVDIDLYILDA